MQQIWPKENVWSREKLYDNALPDHPSPFGVTLFMDSPFIQTMYTVNGCRQRDRERLLAQWPKI